MNDGPHHAEPDKDSPKTLPADEIEAQVRTVIERFLEALEAGETVNKESVLAAHPALANVLAPRLDSVERLHRAVLSTDQGLSTGQEEEPTEAGDEAAGDSMELPEATGKYQLLEVIGRGAFGVVYKALDVELERLVALKMPRAGCFSAPEDEERFLREARSAASLRHPGIVQVHEILELEGVPCIVSEYIEGRTLSEVVQGVRVGFREAAEIAVQVAEALDYAHRHKVIHRDVKPGNILFDAARKPYVTDFGLARRDDGDLTVTLEGEVLGTPAYMSPEQARGAHEAVDARTDVYSLGTVLYELITGVRPFNGNKSMVIYQVINDEPRPPRRLNHHVPRDLETICLKAMAKEPARRYTTAAELAEDLRRFLRAEPVRARPVGAVGRLWRWCRRKPVSAGLAVTIVLLLVTVAVVSTVMAILLEGANVGARRNAEREKDARIKEHAALEESRSRLVRLHVATAVRHMEGTDITAALPHLAEALRLDQGGPAHERMHRLRLGGVLARCPRPVHIWLHAGKVMSAEFSPDGRLVVTACEDGGARVWSLETGKPACPPLRHGSAVLRAEFNHTGALIATASANGTARLWRWGASETKAIATLPHNAAVIVATFQPDGDAVLTASHDATAQVWSSVTGERLGPALRHAKALTHAVFSPDGGRVATSSSDGTAAVWDWNTGKQLCTVTHRLAVHHVEFSPDGLRLVTAGQDSHAQIWSASTGGPLGPPLKCTLGIRYAAFSPDGRNVVTSGWAGAVRLWDSSTSEEVAPVLDHAMSTRQARFSPDGRRILVAGADGIVLLWDPIAGKLAAPPMVHGREMHDAVYSRDGSMVLTASSDGTVRLWDLTWSQSTLPPLRHEDDVNVARFTPDGNLVATASSDGTAVIWNALSGDPMGFPLQHDGSIASAAFDPRGRWLATGGRFSKLPIWEVATGRLLRSFKPSAESSSVDFSPDGRLVAAAGVNGTVGVWEVETGTQFLSVARHKGEIRALAFSPDSKLLAVGGLDGTAQVWDIAAGKPRAGPLQHGNGIFSAAFSPSGPLLATGTADAGVFFWDLTTGDAAVPPAAHSSRVGALRFSKDGRLLLSVGFGNSARVWDARSGEPRSRVLSHAKVVPDASFSGDESLVATASRDSTALVWDWTLAEPAGPPLRHADAVRTVEFAPGDRRLLTASIDGTARIWELAADERPVADLIALAELLSGRRLEETGSLTSLEKDDLLKAWTALRDKYPNDFETSKERLLAWRRREAAESLRSSQWNGALFHLDPIIQAGSAHWAVYLDRGRALAELSQWDGAEVDYRKAISLRGADVRAAYQHAALLLAKGDLDGYRDVCRRLIEAFGDVKIRRTANIVAWTCALGPQAVEDFTPVVALSRRVVAEYPHPDNLNTLGAVLYRAGLLEAAAAQLAAAAGARSARRLAEEPLDWLFLAMARRQLGERGSAAECRSRALSLIEEADKQASRGERTTGSHDWTDRLEIQLLRREAEEMLGR